MDLKEMTIEQLEERKAAIASEIDAPEADLDALEEEARSIKEEIETRKKEEAKKAEIRSAVAAGEGEVVKKIEEVEVKKSMTVNEVRSSKEYEAAYLEMLKTRDDSECRALLTTNTTGTGLTGYVPVPTFLENEIRTAWEEHRLMGLVKKSSFKGNVKIGFELSATGASVHVEGTDAPTEEVVTLGTVEIKAEMIKKWIRVSDEALEGTTVDTAGYLYKEIAHRIVEKAEEILVGVITANPAAATSTAVGVPQLAANPAKDTILNALALLSGEASNVNIAMNRATYAAFRLLELNANYGIDVFEGLRDRIVFTDKLPAFSAASTGDVYMIIGDFGRGVQANFPNGDSVQMLTDPYTDAQADLVKIVGRQYVGINVVSDKALVNVKKAATA